MLAMEKFSLLYIMLAPIYKSIYPVLDDMKFDLFPFAFGLHLTV